jgi:hypothetical protein
MGQHAIEAFGEDFTRAIWHIAEPTPAVDMQAHSVAAPGQVERPSKVAAVLTPAQLATPGARDGLARRLGNQEQTPVLLHDHQHNLLLP